MASAGRILIMPKGNYDANTEYEMLDLVFNGGASWVAKKNVMGIEPTDENTEHWMKMCESVDLTEVIQRIAALESQMLGTISLDDIDLSGYATKGEVATVSNSVNALSGNVDTLSGTVNTLNGKVNGIDGTVSGLSQMVSGLSQSMANATGKFAVVSYKGDGTSGNGATPGRVTFDFAPKVIMLLGYSNSVFYNNNYYQNHTSIEGGSNNENVIYCDLLSTSYSAYSGFAINYTGNNTMRYARKSTDGKTIEWYISNGDVSSQCTRQDCTYYVLGIG